jgi:hypothetical protein
VLQRRRLPAVDRPPARRAILLALLLLAGIPAAAQAGTFKVDGRVTGPPTVKRGAVAVPLQLTKRAGGALKFGTRSVRVRFSRGARLALSGAGASGVSRLGPSALLAGDRLTGVTSISKKARLRLRYRVVPTLKLKRARVIRAGTRALASPGAPAAPGARVLPGRGALPGPPAAPPRTIDQIVADLQTQTTILAARGTEFGPLHQKIVTQRLQLENVKTGLEGVTLAFDELTTALEGLVGVDELALEALLFKVDTLIAPVEALETGIGEIESALGELESGLGKLRGASEKLVPTVASLAAQVALIQQTPGAQPYVTALEATTRSLNGRLDTAEAALNSFDLDTAGLIAGMESLVNSIGLLASDAESGASVAALSAGVDGLGPAVAGIVSGFGGLQAAGNTLVPTAAAIEVDAPLLETTVGELCSLMPTTCP